MELIEKSAIHVEELQLSPEVASTPREAHQALSDDESEALLARMPELPDAAREELRLPQPAAPLPRPGDTRPILFPPQQSADRPAVERRPPRILRRAPEGDVEKADHLTITFSEPMVELTSHHQLAAGELPVGLAPEPLGKWRWMGTRTLTFEPEKPFARATTFTITSRAPLEPESWSFTTPPPRGKQKGQETVGPEPTLTLEFDVPVEADSVLERVSLGSGGTDYPLRAADSAQPHIVRVVPEHPLPLNTLFELRVAPGVRALEGPNPSLETHTRAVRTYGPLALVKTETRLVDYRTVDRTASVALRFNNPLAVDRFRSDLVNLGKATASGYEITVALDGAAGSYALSVAAELEDAYGQRLGEVLNVDVTVPLRDSMAYGANEAMVMLDPTRPLVFPVFTLNVTAVRIKAVSVTPQEWEAFVRHCHYDRRERRGGARPAFSGTVALSRSVQVKNVPDEFVRTDVDLSTLFPGAVGHVVVNVAADPPQKEKDWPICAWLQATRLGLSAYRDLREQIGMAVDAVSGLPAEVSMRVGSEWRPADAQGVCHVGEGGTLVARRGDDVAFLPSSAMRWTTGSHLVWYVFDDRGLYRPGEEVCIKGWVRQRAHQGSELELARLKTLRYEWKDARHVEMEGGSVEVGPEGAFELRLALPEACSLGTYYLTFSAAGQNYDHYHHFRVEEFRRPEFEVRLESSPGPYLSGRPLQVTTEAAYFSGGALPGAPVEWTIEATTATFHPPGRSAFFFGTWNPRWYCYPSAPSLQTRRTGTTDSTGKHRLELELGPCEETRVLTVRTAVTDVNRQQWGASRHLVVHSGELLVGLRPRGFLYRPDESMPVEVLVTDLDGNPMAGVPVELWTDSHNPRRITSEAGPVIHEFQVEEPGYHRLHARVRDPEGRSHRTSIPVWLWGAAALRQRPEAVQLILDRTEYQPGDTATVMVQAPFARGEGMLRVGSGVMAHWSRFQLEGGGALLSFPVTEALYPNAVVRVDLVSPGAGHPVFASGQMDLEVPPRARTLQVDVQAERPFALPDSEVEVTVRVRGCEGRPCVDAEVALVVVDEAVLFLAGYRIPDPLKTLYPDTPGGLYEDHLYARILVPELEKLMADARRRDSEGLCYCRAQEPGPAAPPGVAARVDFRPLALFAPDLRTDVEGKVTARVHLPSNLTRYRITAVALARRRCGLGEGHLTVRKDLMVRPSPPRFLNFGDRFELPVVVQNLTPLAVTATVAVRGSNLALTGARGMRVRIPAMERCEVRFEARAQSAGTAAFQVVGCAGEATDGCQMELPVFTPATTEAFATYGQLDRGTAALGLRPPGEVFPRFGGLEVELSSTALQGLGDACRYIWEYPYGCVEQVSSKILGAVAMENHCQAFGFIARSDLRLAVQGMLDSLAGHQRQDGGFGFWMDSDDPVPFVSIHAAHAIGRAVAAGYSVRPKVWSNCQVYLESLARNQLYMRTEHDRPPLGPAELCLLRSYAVWVLARYGKRNSLGNELLSEMRALGQVPLEAWAWLLPLLTPALQQEALRDLHNRVRETAGAAGFDYQGDLYHVLGSARRADALILSALMETDPDSDLVPKLVNGLQGHRVKGRWHNTQENVFAILALGDYFTRYERETPDMLAGGWLGQRLVFQQAFQGRSQDRHRVEVPMETLLEGGPTELVLHKEGPGRLYYRAGLRYAPRDLDLQPAVHGFSVFREYRALNDPTDVRRGEDGTWRIRAGARVQVQVKVVNRGRRCHMALVDPLPAGLEAVAPPRNSYRWGSWYQHTNFRDDRVEAFSTYLPEGSHVLGYHARATTPGQFCVPPARAEEMYAPETFGRSASDRVFID